MFVSKARVEALTLSLACTGKLGTSWGSLGRRWDVSADLLLIQVHSWLDYTPGVWEKLELELGKQQSFTMWRNEADQ